MMDRQLLDDDFSTHSNYSEQSKACICKILKFLLKHFNELAVSAGWRSALPPAKERPV